MLSWFFARSTVLAALAAMLIANPASTQQPQMPDSGDATVRAALAGLSFRPVGPAIMGGRISAIAGIPGDPTTYYYGHASGGVFKTENGGTTFRPIFDEVGVHSIGAIAIAPSDHNVIYVGTGEGNPRNSASVGRGVFRSVDAGETWTFIGLGDTEKIARIRVHPTDPDVAYVAALGHEWGANSDRGVYKTADGGDSWERVLFVNGSTGAADLAMDPENPRILYATMYDFLRRPWHLRSGGTGSGLYRSADGGETWTNLFDARTENGLPEGLIGRIGVAVAPSDADVVYAIIENQTPGLIWRSTDRGRTWTEVSDDARVNSRGFYYSDLRVDTENPDRLYSINGTLMVSSDGGRTWDPISTDIHPDHQAFWIDPTNANRLLDGTDGGLYVSHDRGDTWMFLNNVPLGQFYQIGADMQVPYQVCGGLQDNGVWCGPSKTRETVGLVNDNWTAIHYGDGYYAQIDPTDWTTVYTNAHYGNIVRVDRASYERRSIQPYPVALRGSPAGDHPFRFNWNSPIHMSPSDPSTVYFGGNVLFRTRDGGQSWDQISPDLTTNDSTKHGPSGGEITVDNTSAEYHTTIVTIAESPRDPNVIWVGTDDGYVQLTTDGGTSWTNVTENLPGVPSESWVTRIHASFAERGTAYATIDRHRSDDMRPYVFKTSNLGESWTDITDNLPEFGFLKVVREDPRNPNVVYVGSEFGLYVSLVGGGEWMSLNEKTGLPPAPVNDLLIHPRDNDLIVGTHGRSIWILDDLTPIQNLTAALESGPTLFAPRDAIRYEYHFTKPFLGQATFKPSNPTAGALLSYYLPDAVADSVQLTIEDQAGEVVKTIACSGEAGIHRLTWEFDFEASPPGGGFIIHTPPYKVLPGQYSVRLTAGDTEVVQPLRVLLDPALDVSEADLVAQVEAIGQLVEMRQLADEAIEEIGSVQEQVDGVPELLEDESGEAVENVLQLADAAHEKLEEIRLKLVSELGGYRSATMLRGRIDGLLSALAQATQRPTDQQAEWVERFETQLQVVLSELRTVLDTDIHSLNQAIEAFGLPAIRTSRRPVS